MGYQRISIQYPSVLLQTYTNPHCTLINVNYFVKYRQHGVSGCCGKKKRLYLLRKKVEFSLAVKTNLKKKDIHFKALVTLCKVAPELQIFHWPIFVSLICPRLTHVWIISYLQQGRGWWPCCSLLSPWWYLQVLQRMGPLWEEKSTKCKVS